MKNWLHTLLAMIIVFVAYIILDYVFLQEVNVVAAAGVGIVLGLAYHFMQIQSKHQNNQ